MKVSPAYLALLFLFSSSAIQAQNSNVPLDIQIEHPSAPNPAKACRNKIVEGPCSVSWRGAVLQMDQKGLGGITTSSKAGEMLRWSFSCQTDRVEGTRTCSISGGTVGHIAIARIYTSGDQVTNLVMWGGSKFPGSEKVARIGNFPVMRWDADETVSGNKAVRVIEAAKRGGNAIFRWFDWPWENSHDEEVNFENFDIVWSLFKAAVD